MACPPQAVVHRVLLTKRVKPNTDHWISRATSSKRVRPEALPSVMASASESKADVAAPKLLDLTIDNITPNAIKINSQSPDARLRYLMARLITHLHDFARETRLSTEEWMAGLNFLIGTGKMCTDLRNVSAPHVQSRLCA